MGHDMRFYQQYLDHLFRQEEDYVNSDPLRKYASGYEDFLQNPLQPLMDNLESGTYEVFEKVLNKYVWSALHFDEIFMQKFGSYIEFIGKKPRTLNSEP